MDDTATSYSNRANAKRAAEKMIVDGTAPSIDYGIKPRDDGRFEIKWKTNPVPATEPVAAEIAATTETATGGDQAPTGDDPFSRIWDPQDEALQKHKEWYAAQRERNEPAAPEPAAAPQEPTTTDASEGELTQTPTVASPPRAPTVASSSGSASDPAESEPAPAAPPPPDEPDPFPTGSSVQLRARPVGQVSHRVDERNWAVT